MRTNNKLKILKHEAVTLLRKFIDFSVPNRAGDHWPNSPWRVIIKLFPARESLVSDIPAGDLKIDNLFLQCNRVGDFVILSEHLRLGCPRNEKNKFSVRTETNRNKICFAFVSVCFVKPNKFFFGLFRFFEPISKQPKQTELFRNEPKQSGIFWQIGT